MMGFLFLGLRASDTRSWNEAPYEPLARSLSRGEAGSHLGVDQASGSRRLVGF